MNLRCMKHEVLCLCFTALPCAGAYAGAPDAGLAQGVLEHRSVEVDGQLRSYDLFVSAGSGEGRRPLVLLYHGHGANSDLMTGATGRRAPYKVWMDIARTEQLLVAFPNGSVGPDGKRGWNDCRTDASTNPRVDDVAFTSAMIDAIAKDYPVDRHRIYAAGTSNGGHMVLRLALELSSRIAAVAPVVASLPAHNGCTAPSRPVSVLFMNGTADPILPFDGGPIGRPRDQRGAALATREAVRFWVRFNGAQTTPVVSTFPTHSHRAHTQARREVYGGGHDGSEVVLYEVIGGGHTEPSMQERYDQPHLRRRGGQSHDIEMAREIWEFFRDKRR